VSPGAENANATVSLGPPTWTLGLRCAVEVPMLGLAIGQQLHWLKEQLR